MHRAPPQAPEDRLRASSDDPGCAPEPRDPSQPGEGEPGGGGDPPASEGNGPPGGGWWRNPAARFVILFIVYLLTLAYFYPKARERYTWVMDALAEGTAAIQYFFFLPFASDVALNEKVVVLNGFAVQIIEECTGLYEVLIYTAAVLAFPTSWAKKGLGLLLGCPLLYLCNVVRIAVLMVVGRYYPPAFEFMHLYLWQATLILFIVSVWMLWIYKVVRRGGET